MIFLCNTIYIYRLQNPFDWHFKYIRKSVINICLNYNNASKYQYSITMGKETMQLNEVVFKHLILKQHFGYGYSSK